jgi:chemosensory pili system protein ChpB (putative protein-glutamate methylesterase)
VSEQNHGIPIALLYESREGGEHLRSALAALGAKVVYEATAAELDRERLAGSHASVVVVNLDDEDHPALDAIYGLLDEGRWRVVFNDGQVSGSLSGWDQARWSRHLAAKLFGDDIDPPRPADAEPVPARVGAPPAAAVEESGPLEARAGSIAADSDASEAPATATAEPFAVDPPAPAPAVQDAPMAVGHGLDLDLEWDAPAAHEDASPGMPLARDDSPITIELESEQEPDIVGDLDALLVDLDIAADVPTAPQRPDEIVDVEMPTFDMPENGTEFDALPGIESAIDFSAEFAADLDAAPDPRVASQSPGRSEQSPARIVSAPLDWSLEDVAEGDAGAPASAKPADFGIETVSPAEYLAPEDTQDPRAAEFTASGLSLELIPLEEAVAPTAIERPDTEVWLDPDAAPSAKIRKVWVLGASIGGPEALREFLGEFPRNFPAVFLLAQHIGAEFVDMMARQLAKSTVMTVRTPTHGERVSHGEVVIVSGSHRLQVGADGIVLLERASEDLPFSPSIDQVIEDAAERYGDAAGAIIFSGVSEDAVRGCGVLAAKGGRIYVQSPESAVVSSMIDAVTETGVVAFTGSPKELATKLIQDGA